MKRQSLDLLREVIDHEIVDAEGEACGVVDDIAFRNTAAGPVIDALLVGPGAWLPRLPALLHWLGARIFGSHVVRVPWSEVERVTQIVQLKSKATAVQLGRLDRKAGSWLSVLPKS
jgi:sporulation protein YlmC with PRC-barrel domain